MNKKEIKIVKGIVWFLSVITLSNFFTRILENDANINIWVTRGIGCMIAAALGLVLYKYFYCKTFKFENKFHRN